VFFADENSQKVTIRRKRGILAYLLSPLVNNDLDKVAKSLSIATQVSLPWGDMVFGKEWEKLNVRGCNSLNQSLKRGLQTVAD
jgi:hypothetical protein